MLEFGVATWVLIWTLASPLALLSGAGALVLVFFDKSRAAGRALGAATAIVAACLTLLFGKAYMLTRHSGTENYELFPTAQRADAALINGSLALIAVVQGVTAAVLAHRRLSRLL